MIFQQSVLLAVMLSGPLAVIAEGEVVPNDAMDKSQCRLNTVWAYQAFLKDASVQGCVSMQQVSWQALGLLGETFDACLYRPRKETKLGGGLHWEETSTEIRAQCNIESDGCACRVSIKSPLFYSKPGCFMQDWNNRILKLLQSKLNLYHKNSAESAIGERGICVDLFKKYLTEPQ
jgi:hypothetical protein